jgi:hypothetical protein
LNDLGSTFYDDVNSGDFKGALITLEKIEKRSGQILSVMFSLQKADEEHGGAIKALEKELELVRNKLNAKREAFKNVRQDIMVKAEKVGVYASSVGTELF